MQPGRFSKSFVRSHTSCGGIAASAGLRRPPNAFNFLRQHEVLSRAGVVEETAAVPQL